MTIFLQKLLIAVSSKRVWIVLLATTFCLSACIANNCEEECEPNQMAALELSLLGVSISPLVGPTPERVTVETVGNGEDKRVGATSLSVAFTPSPEFKTSYDFSYPEERKNGYPYVFFYSKKEGSEYMAIQPSSESTSSDASGALQESPVYDGDIFQIDGEDHILTSPIVSIPLVATHIELWHRVSLSADPYLVRRVPLSSLFAWNQYFSPAVLSE